MNYSDGDSLKEKTSQGFEFDGSWDELLPIFLINLFFTIITLGLFRFWAKTRVRQYIWSHIKFKGDAFEYTGKGSELFFGFLIVLVLVLIPMGILIFQIQVMIMTPGQENMGNFLFLVFYTLTLFLMGLARYRRNIYRMSRTRWRGIKGHQKEQGFTFGLLTYGYSILNIFSLGIAYPYTSNELWLYEQKRREFGNAPFNYNGDPGPLYKPFFQSFGLLIIGLIALLFWIIFIGSLLGTVENMMTNWLSTLILMLAIYIPFLLVPSLAMLFFMTKQLNHFWSNSTFQGIPFKLDVSLGEVFRVWVGMALIYILTFGLGSDFAEMRWIKFLVQNIKLEGEVNLDEILQNHKEGPSFGEGLAEGFDLGGI